MRQSTFISLNFRGFCKSFFGFLKNGDILQGNFRDCYVGFPQWLRGKESTCNVEDAGSIPGLGRSPEGGYGNLLQYSCLEYPMDRGVCWATVHGTTESQT